MSATQIPLREMQVIGRATREWIIHANECPALTPLGIQYAGLTAAGDKFSFCRLAPRIAVVVGSLAGTGQVWVNSGWQKCGTGDVYVAPARAAHAYHATKKKKWRVCWVAYADAGDTRTMVQGERPELRRESARTLRDAIMGLYEEVHGLNEAATVHHWAELVDRSARRLVHQRQIDERLLALWKDVDRELARPWTLGSLAKRVHLSSEQLRHLCQKNLGRSPIKHLAYLRMKRAAVLLVRTNQKVAAIAEAVGYENAFAFSTAFKRMIGRSPVEFARER